MPYAAGSSAPSCTTCPDPRGAQFYTDFAQMAGLASLKASATARLTYKLKLPVDFSWGGTHFGIKWPGLYGGAAGSGTGGIHKGGWTTRYMSRALGAGEVYLEGPSGVTYGIDLGPGSWSFHPDGQWHELSQLVDLSAKQVTVWYDGAQVLQAPLTGIPPAGFSGIMFSTFYGGHDTSWGPPHATSAMFADFSISQN